MDRVTPLIRKYWILIVIVLVLLLGLIAYLLGYRLGPGVHISRVGVLSLEQLPPGATVYADQTVLGTAPATTTMSFDLAPGTHSIIVSVNGDYPWNDLVSVGSGQTFSIRPILIPEHPNVTVLTGADRTTALTSTASTTLPSEANPLRLAHGCAVVYVSNNQVLAEATSSPGCTPPPYLCANGHCAPTIIFPAKPALQAVFKYTGREDALVVGFNNTLYALALDPRSPQYFAPILGATHPVFGVLPNGTIVINNDGMVYRVNL